MSRIVRWEVLNGLPGEGPMPKHFHLGHQTPWAEGFVVRFWNEDGTEWIGNFRRGGTEFSTLLDWCESNLFVVVAAGTLYFLAGGTLANCMPHLTGVTDFILDDKRTIFVTAEVGGRLMAYGRNGELVWTRKRVAVDVVKFKSCKDGVITLEVDNFDSPSFKAIRVSVVDGLTLG
jgi:hypothetical protein